MNVLQSWVESLTMMQQTVLLAAIRGPDGIRKDHAVKVLMRWYRRCFLVSALDKKIFKGPYGSGGGSFTGPFTEEHREEFGILHFDEMRKVYLRHIDELPHHFQLHFMHAAQILGYKHPVDDKRIWWNEFYRMIVNDAHLYPESEKDMDYRLGDNEKQWRDKEEVTAK